MRQQTGAPFTLFYSYAHEDESLREQFEKHLRLLSRQGLISEWHDRQIVAGTEWEKDIDEHLNTASIILLLISPDFLASDYCYDIEMERALQRHQRGEAHVIPIILRPCDWQKAPFAHLQVLPRDGKAVTTWQNTDEAFLAIAEELRRVIERQQIPIRPLPDVARKNRRALIKRVRTTWIEGLLERSLHEAVRLELHLQERPDVLASSLRLQVQELDRPPQPLPAGTSIVQMYDEADGELLILGEPGTGKTTLLLELARTLLERAEADERPRIPVVFNLSSWAQKRPPLSEWLIEGLTSFDYQVPRKMAQSWVASDQILPLLDGLDEVAEAVRSDCAQAINTYHQDRLEKGPAPLVVCCRSKEYLALLTRVNLHQAVSIQPLTDEQIECYLQSAKGQLQELWHALHLDTELYELVHRPLMLNIFTLAYQGAARAELPIEGTSEAQQRQVFVTYVKRMLERRGVSKRFSQEQTRRWLTFVAAGMQQHHQTVFYLERLQPDWLRGRGRRLLYRLSVGLFAGLVYGLVCGLIVGLLGARINGLIHGLLFGLIFGLIVGLVVGLVVWLTFGLSQIKPRELLTQSWRVTKRNIVDGLIVGLLFGLIFGLVSGLLGGLMGGLIVGLISILASGFSRNQPDERTRLTPNQGIWRSAQNGLILGLGLSVGLFGGLLFGHGLIFGLSYGLLFGLFGGLLFGLGTFFQHFALRFWLWSAHFLPWKLAAFLDEAVERLLLRKVGGGYIFIHRLLLDYFADSEKKDP